MYLELLSRADILNSILLSYWILYKLAVFATFSFINGRFWSLALVPSSIASGGPSHRPLLSLNERSWVYCPSLERDMLLPHFPIPRLDPFGSRYRWAGHNFGKSHSAVPLSGRFNTPSPQHFQHVCAKYRTRFLLQELRLHAETRHAYRRTELTNSFILRGPDRGTRWAVNLSWVSLACHGASQASYLCRIPAKARNVWDPEGYCVRKGQRGA